MVDVLPRQLGDVHQPVDPSADLDEGAEVDDGRDGAAAALALVQALQELLAALALGLLEEGPAGQDHVVPVAVQLDDLALEQLADVGVEVADPAKLDQRRGQEPAEADVQDQAALDHFDHRSGDGLAGLHDVLDPAPRALVLGALLGEDQAALLVLLLENQGFERVAELDDLGGIDVLADRQLLGGDDALGLVPDVQEDLVAVHLDDGPLDEVAVLEVLQALLDGLDELLRRVVLLRLGHLALRSTVDPASLPSCVCAVVRPPTAPRGCSLDCTAKKRRSAGSV